MSGSTQNSKSATGSVSEGGKNEPVKFQISSKLTDAKEVAPQTVSSVSDVIADDTLDEIPLEASNKRIYWLGFSLLTIIVIATISAFYLRTKLTFSNDETPQSVTEELADDSIEEVEPLSEVPIQLSRSEITLEILNGSAVAGLAGNTADSFEDLGYSISEVGNTSLTGASRMFINPDFSDRLAVLLDDAEELLNISSVSGELNDSSASARIILGSQVRD
jgi:hypothetical protein